MPSPERRLELSDTVAVIVGAGGGIGRVAARALARRGARLILSDADLDRLSRVLGEVRRAGADTAVAVPADVGSDASVRQLARNAVRAAGGVDVLVNASGVLLRGDLRRVGSNDWLWMLDANLLGAVRTTRAFLPHFQKRGAGHIVNAVALGGLVPGDPEAIPGDSGYAAVIAFTHSLSRLLNGSGIDVSLYVVGATSPRIGHGSRSRGGGGARPLRAMDERSRAAEHYAEALVDAIRHPRFLVLADPKEAASLRRRWQDHELTGKLEVAIRRG